MFNSPFVPAFCAFAGVLLATFVITDFLSYVSSRYRERYLKEAALELDDVLLQMPAARIFDLSVALAIGGAFVVMLGMLMIQQDFAWKSSLILALVVAVGLFPVPRIVLRVLRRRRLSKFNLQLEDALGNMASSLKAGFSILQAIDEVAGQNKYPISVEFRLLMQEIQLGVDLDTALENMNHRLGSMDFELVAAAISTARQTGGELPSTLERLAAVIRERLRIENKVRALTSQGRLQIVVICLMPFMLLLGLVYFNPAMSKLFFGTWLGLGGLAVVVVLMVGCFVVTRKIINIEV